MIADFRLAAAQARRHPWFFAGAALSLAIGMAVAIAVFGVVDAALLRPLPFRDAASVVVITERVPNVRGWHDQGGIPSRHLVAIRDARSLDGVAVWAHTSVNVGGNVSLDGSSALSAAEVSTNFFRVLGARPTLGRDFLPTEGTAGARAVILSHRAWQARFGAEPSLVGREVQLDRHMYRVVGVLPDGVGFPNADLWLAMPDSVIDARAAAEKENTPVQFSAIGRLRRGVSIGEARAELAVIYERTYEGHSLRGGRSSGALPLREYAAGWVMEPLALWTTIAALIAILCAVNFATMSLARGMRRRGEIAVRAALGASTWRVVRMLVAESILIALAGGVAALVLGAWMLQFVQRWFSSGLIMLAPEVSWTMALFALVATTLVGVVFAIAPAVEMAKVDLRSRLQGNAAQTTSRRSELRGRRLLVGLQLSFALTGISAVAALVESDRRHWSADIGIDATGLLLGQFTADSAVGEPAALLLDRIRATNGVSRAAVLGHMRGVSAWTDDRSREAFYSWTARVSPNYFGALGVTLVAGRVPTQAEVDTSARLVLLSAWTATQAFGSAADAIGRRLHLRGARQRATWYTVVGVVPDIGGTALWGIGSQIYHIDEGGIRSGTVVVRAGGDAGDRIRDLGVSTASLRPQLAFGGVESAQAILDADRFERQGRALFGLSIGMLAVVLALLGIYGLTAYDTEVRARELGIRVALGADKRRLAHAVVGELWAMAVIGLLVAVIAASRVTAFLDNRLRNPLAETPTMTIALVPTIAAALTLLVVLLLGTAVPLRRVLRLDVVKAISSGGT